MPYFTRQVAPSGGLIVVAFVMVSQPRRAALQAAGQKIPDAVPIQAMIDTGASCTCVDPSVLQQLGLSPTGSAPVNTPTTGTRPTLADQYDVGIVIPTDQTTPPLIHPTIAVLCMELLVAQGFHALIGRDVLRGCYLTYDGKMGLFSLAY